MKILVHVESLNSKSKEDRKDPEFKKIEVELRKKTIGGAWVEVSDGRVIHRPDKFICGVS